jgi:antirestriction protein ArdC
MAKSDGFKAKTDAYHQQFAERVIEALKKGTAPWQKPWAPGEPISPQNFASGRSYRGGNAMYLSLAAGAKGYADPRWGGYRQIVEAGGHVKRGEKGTPIMYVEFRKRTLQRDEQGQPRVNKDGHPQYSYEQRDRPMVKMHVVFNVEQTQGLKLPPLEKKVTPEWEQNKRVQGVMEGSGVRVDHVRGDRAYYSQKSDRVVVPELDQFKDQASHSHTVLHELGHATGHESRLNRPTLTEHGGFGSETYAREELRAEMAAMMSGERLGVGHEPRHGQAYVASWIKALENDPKEIRAAAVDAQRMSDWLVSRERTAEQEQERDKDAEEREAPGRSTPAKAEQEQEQERHADPGGAGLPPPPDAPVTPKLPPAPDAPLAPPQPATGPEREAGRSI